MLIDIWKGSFDSHEASWMVVVVLQTVLTEGKPVGAL